MFDQGKLMFQPSVHYDFGTKEFGLDVARPCLGFRRFVGKGFVDARYVFFGQKGEIWYEQPSNGGRLKVFMHAVVTHSSL